MSGIFVTEPKVKIRKLKPGQKGFQIQGDITLCDRAAIEIDPRCPSNISNYIMWAYQQGYIKPVAYVTEQELTFMGLTQ